MEQRALKRSYPSMRQGERGSFGGSQNWFADRTMQRCGCGVVACADVLLYLKGQSDLSRDEYLRYAASIRRYFPLIPGHGIDGLRLAWGLNRCLQKAGLPYRARWSASGKRFWERLTEMLGNDLPVILSIGPNFPRIWGKQKLRLFRRTEDGAYVLAESTRAHFVTVTGYDGEWLEISSWGRRLYISRQEYEQYMRGDSTAVLSNLMYLKRTG